MASATQSSIIYSKLENLYNSVPSYCVDMSTSLQRGSLVATRISDFVQSKFSDQGAGKYAGHLCSFAANLVASTLSEKGVGYLINRSFPLSFLPPTFFNRCAYSALANGIGCAYKTYKAFSDPNAENVSSALKYLYRAGFDYLMFMYVPIRIVTIVGVAEKIINAVNPTFLKGKVDEITKVIDDKIDWLTHLPQEFLNYKQDIDTAKRDAQIQAEHVVKSVSEADQIVSKIQAALSISNRLTMITQSQLNSAAEAKVSLRAQEEEAKTGLQQANELLSRIQNSILQNMRSMTEVFEQLDLKIGTLNKRLNDSELKLQQAVESLKTLKPTSVVPAVTVSMTLPPASSEAVTHAVYTSSAAAASATTVIQPPKVAREYSKDYVSEYNKAMQAYVLSDKYRKEGREDDEREDPIGNLVYNDGGIPVGEDNINIKIKQKEEKKKNNSHRIAEFQIQCKTARSIISSLPHIKSSDQQKIYDEESKKISIALAKQRSREIKNKTLDDQIKELKSAIKSIERKKTKANLAAAVSIKPVKVKTERSSVKKKR